MEQHTAEEDDGGGQPLDLGPNDLCVQTKCENVRVRVSVTCVYALCEHHTSGVTDMRLAWPDEHLHTYFVFTDLHSQSPRLVSDYLKHVGLAVCSVAPPLEDDAAADGADAAKDDQGGEHDLVVVVVGMCDC